MPRLHVKGQIRPGSSLQRTGHPVPEDASPLTLTRRPFSVSLFSVCLKRGGAEAHSAIAGKGGGSSDFSRTRGCQPSWNRHLQLLLGLLWFVGVVQSRNSAFTLEVLLWGSNIRWVPVPGMRDLWGALSGPGDRGPRRQVSCERCKMHRLRAVRTSVSGGCHSNGSEGTGGDASSPEEIWSTHCLASV